MILKKILNAFTETIDDPLRAIKFSIKILGGLYGFIIAAIGFIKIFTNELANLEMYGIIGLIYVVIVPIIAILLLFFNAYIVKREIKLNKILRYSFNIFITGVFVISGIWLHQFKRSTKIFFVSEGYIYSTRIFDNKLREVYNGTPKCLDKTSLKKFEAELTNNPYQILPTALFTIPKRLSYDEYTFEIVFGRNTYKDTLYKDLYLNSSKDTLWIRLKHLDEKFPHNIE